VESLSPTPDSLNGSDVENFSNPGSDAPSNRSSESAKSGQSSGYDSSNSFGKASDSENKLRLPEDSACVIETFNPAMHARNTSDTNINSSSHLVNEIEVKIFKPKNPPYFVPISGLPQPLFHKAKTLSNSAPKIKELTEVLSASSPFLDETVVQEEVISVKGTSYTPEPFLSTSVSPSSNSIVPPKKPRRRYSISSSSAMEGPYVYDKPASYQPLDQAGSKCSIRDGRPRISNKPIYNISGPTNVCLPPSVNLSSTMYKPIERYRSQDELCSDLRDHKDPFLPDPLQRKVEPSLSSFSYKTREFVRRSVRSSGFSSIRSSTRSVKSFAMSTLRASKRSFRSSFIGTFSRSTSVENIDGRCYISPTNGAFDISSPYDVKGINKLDKGSRKTIRDVYNVSTCPNGLYGSDSPAIGHLTRSNSGSCLDMNSCFSSVYRENELYRSNMSLNESNRSVSRNSILSTTSFTRGRCESRASLSSSGLLLDFKESLASKLRKKMNSVEMYDDISRAVTPEIYANTDRSLSLKDHLRSKLKARERRKTILNDISEAKILNESNVPPANPFKNNAAMKHAVDRTNVISSEASHTSHKSRGCVLEPRPESSHSSSLAPIRNSISSTKPKILVGLPIDEKQIRLQEELVDCLKKKLNEFHNKDSKISQGSGRIPTPPPLPPVLPMQYLAKSHSQEDEQDKTTMPKASESLQIKIDEKPEVIMKSPSPLATAGPSDVHAVDDVLSGKRQRTTVHHVPPSVPRRFSTHKKAPPPPSVVSTLSPPSTLPKSIPAEPTGAKMRPPTPPTPPPPKRFYETPIKRKYI